MVILGDVLSHPYQLFLDADVAHAQRQNLLVAHEAVVAQQAHGQVVIALASYQEVEELTLLGVRQRAPDFSGQAALLLADLREGILGDVVVLDHPVSKVSKKAEVVVVGPRGDARVHVDVEHERGGHVAVEGTDIRPGAIAPGVEPRPQGLQIGIVRANGVWLEFQKKGLDIDPLLTRKAQCCHRHHWALRFYGIFVESKGVEPLTSCLQGRRSSQLS